MAQLKPTYKREHTEMLQHTFWIGAVINKSPEVKEIQQETVFLY